MQSTKNKKSKTVCYHEPGQCLVHFKTGQGVKIQKLFETLAPLLVEGNIVFTKHGIKLNSLTPVLFANFELKAENLDEYKCDGEYVAGVNFPTLFKYFKTVTQNDAISIQITSEAFNNASPAMFIHIITSTMTYTYRYSLLAIDEVPFEVPRQTFESVVRISSVAFLRSLRSCEQVGDAVQIMTRAHGTDGGVTVYVMCAGLQSNLQVTIKASDDDTTADADAPDILSSADKRERYSLKFLNYIAKATSLNNTVQLFLAAKYALIVRYRVGKLGHVTFGLPPKFDSALAADDIDDTIVAPPPPKRKVPTEDNSQQQLQDLMLNMKRPKKNTPNTHKQDEDRAVDDLPETIDEAHDEDDDDHGTSYD